jgi:hypothetical protein
MAEGQVSAKKDYITRVIFILSYIRKLYTHECTDAYINMEKADLEAQEWHHMHTNTLTHKI